jgi:cytochrome c-type biogenesis protein CcmE
MPMTRKQRRLILIGSSLGVLAIAVALVLSSLRDSIVFFNSPTDIAAQDEPGVFVMIAECGHCEGDRIADPSAL